MRVMWFITFLLVWIAGCAIADYVFEIGANSWRMFFGYIVAIFAQLVADYASGFKENGQ